MWPHAALRESGVWAAAFPALLRGVHKFWDALSGFRGVEGSGAAELVGSRPLTLPPRFI